MSNRRTDPNSATVNVNRPRSPAEALEPTRAPPRPRGPRHREPSKLLTGLARVMSGFMTLVLVIMGAIGSLGLLLNHQFDSPGPLEVSRTFPVPKGEGRIATAARLEREGIIANRWTFVAGHMMQAYVSTKKNYELKAGDYEIKKGATMRQVLEALAEGKSVLARLTIPEGLTSQQIVERIAADPNLSGEVTQIPTEGSLLPDTYRFSKGMSRQELIERMQSEQQRLLAALWDKRAKDLPITSIEQAVILASIVEKETGRADERDRVAGVFVNRLRKGMRLQSDPTIVYGIAGGQGSLGRPITRADIDTKTAYNTYTIPALPPGPICNPGRPAIEAALNPAQTPDLYFVADGSGGHAFSETLKEHNAAVQNWRKVEKDIRSRQQDPQAQTRAVSRTLPAPAGTPAPATAQGSAASGAASAAGGPAAGGSVPIPVSGEPPPAADAGAVAPVAGPAQAVQTSPPLAASAAGVPLPVRKPKK